MSTKNDKSGIVIIVFATLFVLFAFAKQFEDKPTYMIVEIKYISKVNNQNVYIIESKRNNIWYQLETDKDSYYNSNIGTPLKARWIAK